jgi:hypothetical protein
MVDVFIDEPTSQPFTEIHIWIGHYADGTEGILACDFPLPGGLGTRFMPLMHSKHEVAESLAPTARRIQSASQHAANRVVRVELRTFRAVTS